MASARGGTWGAVTFEPHPGVFMGTLEDRLFTLEERECVRVFLEVPRMVPLAFDGRLARLAPRAFWEFLRSHLPIDGIVVGRDFRFGHGRAGDAALLEGYCREAGVAFAAVDALEHLGTKISSSRIRDQVRSGDCRAAAEELGYPYFIRSQVVRGAGRGTGLGFPTANLCVPWDKVLPLDGVYAVAALVDGSWRAGALSVGRNPTFQDAAVTVEVFILDYAGDLYAKTLGVFFLDRLRAQEKFGQVSSLVRQIRADAERCGALFAQTVAANPAWLHGFRHAESAIDF